MIDGSIKMSRISGVYGLKLDTYGFNWWHKIEELAVRFVVSDVKRRSPHYTTTIIALADMVACHLNENTHCSG